MRIIVMKFGGSSLAEPEKIKTAAERALKARRAGCAVVMVVSAPADITDDLINLSKLLATKPDPREYDALLSAGESISAALAAMAVREAGGRAVSLSGAQAGIKTGRGHNGADMLSVKPVRIIRELKKGKIAVVAGFQGLNKSGDIATLGRGGSDLTAVALAHALGARACELYTDVKGVYTANPAVVPQAGKIKKISYDALMELARTGAEVRQMRALAYAKRRGVRLHLRSSFENEEGTIVGDFRPAGKKPRVACLSIRKTGDGAEITLIGSNLKNPGTISAVKQAALETGCPLLKEVRSDGKITLTVTFRDGDRLLKTLHRVFIV